MLSSLLSLLGGMQWQMVASHGIVYRKLVFEVGGLGNPGVHGKPGGTTQSPQEA